MLMKPNILWEIVTAVSSVLIILLGIITAGHALINKRDPKGAFGWITVCIFFPIVGSFFYFIFGINRVQRRAKKLLNRMSLPVNNVLCKTVEAQCYSNSSCSIPLRYSPQAKISDRISQYPICSGNRITVLHNGEEAYPAMLQAIEEAQYTIYLTTYIFDMDETGKSFICALDAAHKRGVIARILIDGIGEMNWGTIASRHLRKRGLQVARYIPPKLFPPTFYINLRNHRKILVIDGKKAFTGGMNISDRHLIHKGVDTNRQTTDMHFRIEGPVASQIEEVFIEDWLFVTRESLSLQPSIPETIDGSFCRVIPDGPDEGMGKLDMILSGIISSAKQNIRIMTPYFLPPRGILAALQAATLRGVCVDIVLPEKNDIPFVQWATRNLLWELLSYDVHIYYQPPPFAHTKLILVDDQYVQIGSANIDSRSLRLNFELNVEIYDQAMAGMLTDYFQNIINRCKNVSLKEMDSRPLPERLRDSFAWLFSSYL